MRGACWIAALCGLPLAAGAEPLEQSFEVAPDVRVEIEILSGEISLRGIDEERVHVRASGGGGIEVDGTRRRVSLRAPATGWFPWARGTGVDLEVEVPRGSRITARTVNGPIRVEGVRGEIDLHAANGEIEVRGAPREAYLETLTSAIRFEGERSAVVARTLSGEIELRGVSGEVEATAVSGRIRVEGEALERAELRSMSGAIELDASLVADARVSARSYSGAVRLLLPRSTSARFDVRSYSGGVESELAARDAGNGAAWNRGPGGRLSFAVGEGEGDARIAIESFSGGVRIEDRGDGP